MKFLIETPSKNVFLPFKYVPFTNKLTSEQNAFINFSHPDLKIFCDQCLSIISVDSLSIFIQQFQHGKEKKTDKDLCVKCFCSFLKSNGKLSDQKMIKGQYYVRNPGTNCLSSSRWRVTDDLLLLQAIKKFGYGNWDKMTYHMQTHGCFMNNSQYKKHFLTYFYKSKLVSNAIFLKNEDLIIKDGSDDNAQKENIKPKSKIMIKTKPLSDHFLQWRGTNNRKKDSISLNMQNFMNQLTGFFQKQDSQQVCDLNLEGENPLMYIPQRDQFLIDHDPYAQSLIADLEFNDDDNEQEIRMKQQLLLAYNEKLKQRKKRKILAMNHNLVRTLAESHEKKNNKQVFFLNKNPQQKITGFLDSFIRLFRDEEEIRLTKTLITNHYNVKEILGTLCWIKKNANVKLSTFKSLESILKNTIKSQSDNMEMNQQNSKQLFKQQKNVIFENQGQIKPQFQQKLIFIQSQIDQNQSNSSIYHFKFDSQLQKSNKKELFF